MSKDNNDRYAQGLHVESKIDDPLKNRIGMANSSNHKKTESFFDEQYFEELLLREKSDSHRIVDIESNFGLESDAKDGAKQSNSTDKQSLGGLEGMHEIDAQYFSGEMDARSIVPKERAKGRSPPTDDVKSSLENHIFEDSEMNDVDAEYFRKQTSHKISSSNQGRREPLERRQIQVRSHGFKEKSDTWSRITSHYKTDPKLNIFQKLIVDLDKEPAYNIVDFLLDSQVYHDEDILVINKPYKLVCQGGQVNSHSLIKYLPEIANRLKLAVPLYLCHRLDRDTTGLVVIAKGPESHAKMNNKFAAGEIEKQYKCITKGVPTENSGIIDLSLVLDSKVGSAYLTIPVTTKPKSKSAEVLPAKTHYQVEGTDDSRTAALLNVQPLTGRKHQIRVHLSSALRTPILGDHKYTNPVKHSPQKLPDEILRKFRIRSRESRNLPMFLHAERLTIPSYFSTGVSLKLRAALPFHFLKAIKVLKFK